MRLNPFKNYSEGDLGLSALDPLLNLELPSAGSTTTTKPKLKSTSSSTSLKKSSSSSTASSSKGAATTTSKVSSTGTERVACDLKSIYPAPGIEISFEELKLRSNGAYSISAMQGWEYESAWAKEVKRKGCEFGVFRFR